MIVRPKKLRKLEDVIKTFTYENDKMNNFDAEELVVKAQEILNDL